MSKAREQSIYFDELSRRYATESTRWRWRADMEDAALDARSPGLLKLGEYQLHDGTVIHIDRIDRSKVK